LRRETWNRNRPGSPYPFRNIVSPSFAPAAGSFFHFSLIITFAVVSRFSRDIGGITRARGKRQRVRDREPFAVVVASRYGRPKTLHSRVPPTHRHGKTRRFSRANTSERTVGTRRTQRADNTTFNNSPVN